MGRLKTELADLVGEWKGVRTSVGRVLFATGCGFVVLGVVGAFYLLNLFSQPTPGFFGPTPGELSVREMLTAVVAGSGMSSYGLLLVVAARVADAMHGRAASRPHPAVGRGPAVRFPGRGKAARGRLEATLRGMGGLLLVWLVAGNTSALAQETDFAHGVDELHGAAIDVAVGFASLSERLLDAAGTWDRFRCAIRRSPAGRDDNVMFSEFVLEGANLDGTGTSAIPGSALLWRLVDFDTGLTWCDIYALGKRAPYWVRRKNEVDRIVDVDRSRRESAALVAEMLADPQMSRAFDSLTGLAGGVLENALSLLQPFLSMGIENGRVLGIEKVRVGALPCEGSGGRRSRSPPRFSRTAVGWSAWPPRGGGCCAA